MMRYNLPSYLLCSRGSRPRDFPILPHRPSWEQSAYTWEQSGQTTNPSGWLDLTVVKKSKSIQPMWDILTTYSY